MRLLRFLGLFYLLAIAGCLYIFEGLVSAIAGSPRRLLGAQPMGVRPIVRWWARTTILFTGTIRGWCGRYVHAYYPNLHQRWEGLFLPR